MTGGFRERVRAKYARDIVPKMLEYAADAYFAAGATSGIVLRTSGNVQSPRLAQLFTEYGSDKGWTGTGTPPFTWPPHNYSEVYELLFRSRRERTSSVVECGIGTNNVDVRSNMTAGGRPGASLRAWRDYFPNATIYGLDIDDRILFTEDRIKTFHVDQLDPGSIARFWSASGLQTADIIIDDGLHTLEAGLAFFESSFSMLASDGIYVIEDVSPSRLKEYMNYFARRSEVVDYFSIHRPSVSLRSNCLLVIRRAE